MVHDFGMPWKQRVLFTSSGYNIKSWTQGSHLLNALLLPQETAVIMVEAHTGKQSTEHKGNALASKAAKAVASLNEVIPIYMRKVNETLPATPEELKIQHSSLVPDTGRKQQEAQGCCLNQDLTKNQYCLKIEQLPWSALYIP